MKQIELQDVQLVYRDNERKNVPVILFIHGFPFSQEMWSKQRELLNDRFRIITYDLRGHGRSGVGDGQYSVELFVDDLMALLDHLKIKQAVLAGLSMGGYVALRAVERHPERVSGLILCNTRSQADTNEVKLKRFAQFRELKSGEQGSFTETFLQAVCSPEHYRDDAEPVRKIRRIISETQIMALCGTLLALASRTDTSESLPGIRVPVLLVAGEKDVITPVEDLRYLQEHIPGALLEVIPGAAHLSNLENPDAFNKALTSFLSRFH